MREDWNKMSMENQDSVLNSMSAQEQVKFASDMGTFNSKAPINVSAPPKTGSIPWMKQKALSNLNRGATWLPTALGVAGSWLGGIAGEAINPLGGGIPGKVIGSGIGGGIGEAGRQGIEHLTGADQYEDPETKAWGNRSDEIIHQTEMQTGAEITGQALGRWLRPTLDRSIAKLYYAGKLNYGDPLGHGDLQNVMDDLINTEKSTGKAITLRDFYDVINQSKKDIGQKVDTQMSMPFTRKNGTVTTLGKAEADPTKIVNAINSLLTADPSIVTEAGLDKAGKEAAYLAYIKKEALKFSQTPRTYEDLMNKRIRLNAELAPLYELPSAGEQRVYLLDHPNLAVAKAEADAIRDTIYPQMDSISGSPIGTTAELQGKRGTLMNLEQQVSKHLGDLKTKALQAHGAPPLEKVNASGYLSSSGKPGGSLHRITGFIHTPNPERAADKQVAKAFGHGAGPNIRRVITTPNYKGKLTPKGSEQLGDEFLSLPLRYLVNPSQPKQPDKNDSTGPQSSVVKPKELIDRAKQLNPSAQGQVAYTHTAVNPATGHRIGSHSGQEWFDIQTGQQVA